MAEWLLFRKVHGLSTQPVNRFYLFMNIGRIACNISTVLCVCVSVRDNVVFSRDFDTARYNSVLEASGLGPDLKLLAAGDQTEIGERGINLSGGQV